MRVESYTSGLNLEFLDAQNEAIRRSNKAWCQASKNKDFIWIDLYSGLISIE